MSEDKIMDAVQEQRSEMLLQIADRLEVEWDRSQGNFVSLAIAALEVIDDWKA